MEYVSNSSKRKDYGESMKKYEHELKVPYYLLFYPDNQELSLFRHDGAKYVTVLPDEAGLHAVPELEMAVSLTGRLGAVLVPGEMLPLPGELLRRLDRANQEAARQRRRADEAEREQRGGRERPARDGRPARPPPGRVAGAARRRRQGVLTRHFGLRALRIPSKLPSGASARHGTSPQVGRECSTTPPTPSSSRAIAPILVEVDNPKYAEARDALAPFAELEKSPEHIHTYRLTPPVAVERRRRRHDRRRDGRRAAPLQQVPPADQPRPRHRRTRQPLRPGPPREVRRRDRRRACRRCASSAPTCRCSKNWPASPRSATTSATRLDKTSFLVDAGHRGVLKQALITVGYPAEDLAGYTEGDAAADEAAHRGAGPACRSTSATTSATPATIFYAGGDVRGGSGVIVLPCGAGKTIVGIAAMALMQRKTLVLTTGITAVKQWHREILDKTDLDRRTRSPSTPASRKEIAAGHPGDLPDPVAPQRQDRGVPALRALRQARLGPHHLRRGPPAARAGLPRHRPDPGPPPARPDRHAGPRGRPRGRRVQPDRPQEVRRALARAGAARLDRRGELLRGPRRPARRPLRMEYAVAEWRNKYRIASENPAKDDVVGVLLRALPRQPRPHHRPVPQAAAPARASASRSRSSPARRRNAEREDLYNKFRTRRGAAH